ncbi:MAG: aspartate dehydrogenase [Candidatus Omnitrophica bacterium]|nr:aspartate dehydrogenase [Candidatus Omnitrophota bacterium]
MSTKKTKLKIGIVGCGAIGSRLAKSIVDNFADQAELSGLYDTNLERVYRLASELKKKNVASLSLEDLIKKSNLVIEASSAKDSKSIAKSVVDAGRDIMIMSVGGMLEAEDVLELAKEKKCSIYFPSGAVAGLDAIKAASFSDIKSITLTTRKPPSGLIGNPYLLKSHFDLEHVDKETVVFEGNVDMAVRLFPQNINVAAVLSLASNCKDKVSVKILTSPEYKRNSHEIIVEGDFGSIKTITENLPCPDNPKTSFLAVLSAMAMLKNILNPIKIGT